MSKDRLQMESLSISKEEYGAMKGTYTGRIKFTSGFGETSLNLDPSFAEAIMAVAEDAIIKSSQITMAKIGESISTALEESKSARMKIATNEFADDEDKDLADPDRAIRSAAIVIDNDEPSF